MLSLILHAGSGEGLQESAPSSSPHTTGTGTATSTGEAGQALPASLSLKEDGESGGEEEEGGGVGQLLRATVEELEAALKDTRQLLAARDRELEESKQDLECYKQQAAREIANKTRLAQALDQSQSHVAQLEELLQNWQLQVATVVV